MTQFAPSPLPRADTITALLDAVTAKHVTLAGMRALVPGPLPIRLSVVLGNVRMQRMLDNLLSTGDIAVDVGANIGYNTLYAARRTGPSGHVYAIEPAQDNLAILYANIFANNLRNVTVFPYAAGSKRERKSFFIRGDVSAVNSLYQENFYHPVTQTVEVLAMPLDDLIPGTPRLVKIDVEGAELEVLHGMTRLLQSPSLCLIVEWHPTLQAAAGYEPAALPTHLLDLGFTLQVVTHTTSRPLLAADLPYLSARLLQKRSPVELLALR